MNSNPSRREVILEDGIYPLFVLALEGGVNSNPSRREVILEDGIYPLFVLALEGGENSNPSSRERLFLRTASPRQDQNSYVHG